MGSDLPYNWGVARTGQQRRKSLTALAAELRRRRVYPVIASYAVVAFVILQIAEIVFEPLRFPNWVMVALIAIVIAGFPLAVVLAWVFDITPAGIRRQPPVAVPAADAAPSIAVLPFADMSPQQDQEFFCEGIAEEILNALTRIPQLRVAARSSSFQYSAGTGDVRKIGRELGVHSILEGSVRKSDSHLRITAQLVRTEGGYHIWSKTFDRNLEDVFAIQDEIATSIAEALVETLTPEQQSAIRTTTASSVGAYEYYLRGRQFFKRFRKLDIEHALGMFRHAINIDADFALAWSGYADCYSFLVMYFNPSTDYRQEAFKASKRALELDPGLAETHASCGLAYLICEEYTRAEAEFEKALALNPNSFEAYYYFGRTRFHQGDMEKAAELFAKAAEVDPQDYQSRCLRVQILRGMGRIDETRKAAEAALKVLERHLDWNPDDARAYHLGAGTLIALGETDRARDWLRRAIDMDPDDSVLLYNVACNLATLGDNEKAFEYLSRAIDNGAVSSAWIRNDEDLVYLHGDPRFAQLIARIEATEHAEPPRA
jgi:adenylate cyclase